MENKNQVKLNIENKKNNIEDNFLNEEIGSEFRENPNHNRDEIDKVSKKNQLRWWKIKEKGNGN